MKRLGNVWRTSRGLERVGFTDINGVPCTLQQSSIAHGNAGRHQTVGDFVGHQRGSEVHGHVLSRVSGQANWHLPDLYLTQACRRLAEIDPSAEDGAQADPERWGDECSGICGV